MLPYTAEYSNSCTSYNTYMVVQYYTFTSVGLYMRNNIHSSVIRITIQTFKDTSRGNIKTRYT